MGFYLFNKTTCFKICLEKYVSYAYLKNSVYYINVLERRNLLALLRSLKRVLYSMALAQKMSNENWRSVFCIYNKKKIKKYQKYNNGDEKKLHCIFVHKLWCIYNIRPSLIWISLFYSQEEKSQVCHICVCNVKKQKVMSLEKAKPKKGRKFTSRKLVFTNFFSLKIFQNIETTRLFWGPENVDKNTQNSLDVDLLTKL